MLTKAVHCICGFQVLPRRGRFQSIRPRGYGPSTLPLRHSALPYCSLAVGSRALIAEIHCGKIAISLRSTCVNYYSEIGKYFQC